MFIKISLAILLCVAVIILMLPLLLWILAEVGYDFRRARKKIAARYSTTPVPLG